MTDITPDTRWDDLAAQLADRLAIVQDDRVSIFFNDYSALPAVHALMSRTLRQGATVQAVYQPEVVDVEELAHSRMTQIAEPAALEVAAMKWSSVHVSFRSMLWPEASDAARPQDLPQRLAAQRQAKGAISTLRWQNTRWSIVRIPTPAWAAQIDVAAETLMDEFFAGALDDWDAGRARWQSVCDAIDVASAVTITSADTDLRLGITGRTAALFAGEANIPDGEVATAPVDDQVDGYITFPGVSVFAGEIFENLFLRFEKGKVVEIRADRGADVARALLDTDGGSRNVGELGIGLSSAVQQWTGDLFLDEKILGTVHIALGRAYPQCGGVNESTLHWDIVKDLRVGAPGGAGTLAIDGKPLVADGVVVWPGLSG